MFLIEVLFPLEFLMKEVQKWMKETVADAEATDGNYKGHGKEVPRI